MIRLCAFADEAGRSLSAQLDALHAHGISLLELRSIDGKDIADFTDAEAYRYKEILDENRIAVHSLGSPLGKVEIADAQKHMETVRRVCELARIFDTDKIRVFSFFGAYGEAERVKEHLRRMVGIASEYGVRLYHENEKKVYGDTGDRVLELMHDVQGLGFVFDPANYIQCGEPVAPLLDCLFDRTDYFHIKDVCAATDEIVPAGEGDGEIPLLIDRIAASGRDAVLTLEPHLKIFDGYAAIDDSQMNHRFRYPTNEASFAAAVNALKALLLEAGYAAQAQKDHTVGWVKR